MGCTRLVVGAVAPDVRAAVTVDEHVVAPPARDVVQVRVHDDLAIGLAPQHGRVETRHREQPPVGQEPDPRSTGIRAGSIEL